MIGALPPQTLAELGTAFGDKMCAMNCPNCQAELHLIASRRIGGARRYAELYLYECETHGMIFRTFEGLNNEDDGPSVRAPLKPMPTLNAGAIALPEPD